MTTPEKREDVEGRPWKLRGYAPGNYECRCLTCSATFAGDKRAISCLPCAADHVEAARLKAEEQRRALMEAVKPFARIGDLIERLGPKSSGAAFSVSEYGEHCRRAAKLYATLSEDADQPLLKTEEKGDHA